MNDKRLKPSDASVSKRSGETASEPSGMKALVRSSYEEFRKGLMRKGRYAFVTVNVDRRSLWRCMNTEEKPLGQRLLDESIDSPIGSLHSFWTRFFLRLKPELYGKRIAKLAPSVEFFGSFENEGKSYSLKSASFHSHLLVYLPDEEFANNFDAAFESCWRRSVMNSYTTKLVQIRHVTSDDEVVNRYLTKQFVNFDVASDRLIFQRSS